MAGRPRWAMPETLPQQCLLGLLCRVTVHSAVHSIHGKFHIYRPSRHCYGDLSGTSQKKFKGGGKFEVAIDCLLVKGCMLSPSTCICHNKCSVD